MPFLTWVPSWLPWLFGPGFFIAIMGFGAAAVTFRKEPSQWEKRIWIFVFFLLMIAEMLMIGRERSKNSEAEDSARTSAKLQSDNITFLLYRSTIADGRLTDIEKAQHDNNNPQKIATLRVQRDQAQKAANDASKAFLAAFAPGAIQQLREAFQLYQSEHHKVMYKYVEMHPKSAEEQRTMMQSHKNDEDRAVAEYQASLRASLVTADGLMEQMLKNLVLSDKDRAESQAQASAFAAALNGDYVNFKAPDAATYLEKLLKRIQANN
jgi:hypothetical protein